MDTMQLGGNIELSGFNDVEKAKLVVIKKMVGNYAKEMSEKNTNFKKLKVTMTQENDQVTVKAEMEADNAIVGEETGNNLFMALDSALKKVVDQL